MFSFFRRRKEADATARRIIDQGRFLGAGTPREAVEMLWGRPLSENEWVRYASVWERIWRESLKERPIESEMRPPYQLRLAISAVTDEPVSGKNATENVANAVVLLTTAIVKKTTDLLLVFLFLYFQTTLPSCYREISRRRPLLR
jgi:hypothetical protein